MELALYHRRSHNKSILEESAKDFEAESRSSDQELTFDALPRRYYLFVKFLEKFLGYI
jgi:hypothetical protein